MRNYIGSTEVENYELEFVRSLSWADVFRNWQADECGENCSADWEKVANAKGWFASGEASAWEQWRSYSASRLNLPELEWSEYQIKNFDSLGEFAGDLLIGPYSGWQNRLPANLPRNKTDFAEAFQCPEFTDFCLLNSKVQNISQSFPQSSQIIVVYRADLQKYVLIEGHHRVSALFLSAQNKLRLAASGNIRVAIALAKTDHIFDHQVFDLALASGSQKP